MAKPPKKIPGSTSPEVSTSSTRTTPDPLTGTRGDTGSPVLVDTGSISGPASPDTVLGTSGPRPSVIVSHMPDPQGTSPTRHSVTETATQDASSTWLAQTVDATVSDQPPHPVFIDPEAANLLKKTPGTSEGIHYDKHKKAYVEMADGMVMVRQGPDGYRHTHAQESTPSGERVEQIPGSHLWRQVSPADTPSKRPLAQSEQASDDVSEATAGPSKRARLSDETSVATEAGALVENLFTQQSNALDLSAGHWKNWGKATKPESGESVEIDGKHYPIVAQRQHSETGLVYLQHPGFAPDHFDAFEHMLRHEPSRQPKWALKRDGQWRVLDNHPPFAMSPSQYVSTAFSNLSDHSASAIARAVFDSARPSEGLNGHGLSVMALTFRCWTDRVNNEAPMRHLSDPLLMLPKLPTRPDNRAAGGILTVPQRDVDGLQRLDFDPQRFPLDWGIYTAAPTAASLRTLFSSVLQNNGYTVNPGSRQHREGALIFRRPGVPVIFILKFPQLSGDTFARNTIIGSELTNPAFQSSLTAIDKQRLASALQFNELVYLVGGVQQSPSANPTLFMVREG